MSVLKNIFLFIISIIIIYTSVFTVSAQITSNELLTSEDSFSYDEYKDKSKYNTYENDVIMSADQIVEISGQIDKLKDFMEQEGTSARICQGSEGGWKITAPDGWYTIQVKYLLEDSRSNYADQRLKINGKVPFDEANSLRLYCSYTYKTEIATDYYGNDIRPQQSKNSQWCTVNIYDKMHYTSEPLVFYLKTGDNLSFEAVNEDIIINSAKLVPYNKLKTYDEALSDYTEKGYKTTNEFCEIYEAEKPSYKTDPVLLPSNDSSPSSSPYDSYKVKLNMISGGNWNTAGQLISWTVNVPKDGLYNITLKARQDSDRGAYSTRRLYINGEVPFYEANNIKFLYSSKWENYTLGGQEPWLFYLKKGENQIAVEATLGDMGVLLKEAQDILSELNNIYRELLVITGATPDSYRDYNLDLLVPETLKNIEVQKERIKNVLNKIRSVTGRSGNNLSVFTTIINQMEEFSADSDKIPSGFNYFKTNIGSFGTWITSALKQPLDLDYIAVSSPGVILPSAEAGFFKCLYGGILSFITSFTVDYNNIGSMSEQSVDSITVWMTSGRDQMQVLKTLIQNDFVQETGISAQLENVDVTSILKAVAAGNGPDVLLNTNATNPVNYALRNAAYDLNSFSDIEVVKARFYSESLVPFTFNGGLYALPEVLNFKVLFYRSDVLREMGLAVPDTWEDVIETISVLQNNNMTFGLPVTDVVGTNAIFMYQNGAELYKDDGKACLISSHKNVGAFGMMTDFFINYSLDLSYNFMNRFRTGEMPLAIDYISEYNSLKVSAPEIEGLWGIAILPGIENGNGKINHTGYITSTASMIIGNTKKPSEAYSFLKWWISEKTQADFGTEIECILGPSSRYLTANKAAFEKLPWTDSELKVLNTQLDNSKAVPEVPGSYYINRHLNNAFRAVVISGRDLNDTLIEYNEVINEELTEKRKEFGLN